MMELFQDMTSITNGGYFNPAYMNSMHLMQENLTLSMDAGACVHAFPRPHHYHHHHHELAEGMDETALSHANSRACNSAMTITPSLHDANSPIGLSTNSSTASRQQFCEIANIGCSSASGKLIKRRSWQEALSDAGTALTMKPRAVEISACIKTHPNMQDPAELTSVDKILNLHHLQAGVTNHSSTDLNQLANCSTLTISRTTKLPLEESLIAAHKKKSNMPMPTNPNSGSFLSALSQGDEAFFKQQLPAPMEGCKDDPFKQTAATRHSAVFEDSEEHYDALDGLDMRRKYMEQHGFNELIYEQLIWGHQECSVVSDLSIGTPKMGSKDRITRPSNAFVDVNYVYTSNGKEDDENVRASQDSGQSWEANARRLLGANVGEALHVDSLESKKRSLPDLQGSACYNMAHSKRAHLGPHARDSNPRHPISSSTSLSMSTVIDGSTIKSNGKSNGKRNPLGPALNTNLKPRARQGTAIDPQTIAARNRRERINARLKVLQELVPNGSKVDLVTMLEKAINYVKYLQLQLRVLSNDELWEANHDVEKVAMQHELISKSEGETNISADCVPTTSSISTSTSN